MSTENLSIMPVEVRDLPWISALLQKMVDMSFSQFVSSEQIDVIMAKECSQEALTDEMRTGSQLVKLVIDDDILGIASYRPVEQPLEVRVEKLYALPGENEEGIITRLVNYIKEQASQTGYELLSLFLPPGDQHKLELLTRQGFAIRGLEKVDVCDGLQLVVHVLTADLRH